MRARAGYLIGNIPQIPRHAIGIHPSALVRVRRKTPMGEGAEGRKRRADGGHRRNMSH